MSQRELGDPPPFAGQQGQRQGRHGADTLLRGLRECRVEVITPNPATSGGAKWNIMAAYGAQLKLGKSEEEAIAYLEQLFAHVSVQDKSAR